MKFGGGEHLRFGIRVKTPFVRWLSIVCILIIISSLFPLINKIEKVKASGTTYFVNNAVVGGNNDGSSWPNAFHSIADLEAVLVTNITDTIYIKPNVGLPYREFLGDGKFTGKTIYGDAVGGTGIETTRGTTKSEFWASVDTTSYTWSQEGSSNIYRHDSIDLTDPGHNTPVQSTNAVAWYYTTPITKLLGYGASCPTDITTLGLNTVCYNSNTLQVWINIGTNPTGLHVEIEKYQSPLEIWTDENLYGVIGKHGLYGIFNGGCSHWIIEGIELLYNNYGTNSNASDPNTSSYFTRSSIHDNKAGGVYINSSLTNTHYQNNLIYNNGSPGIRIQTWFPVDQPTDMGYIENNTIYNNGAYGIYIKNIGDPDAGDHLDWTVKNNIVIGHTTAQLFLYDIPSINLVASNNAPGATKMYTGTHNAWATYKGSGFVETDPLMVDPANQNFKLQSSSPAKDAGLAIDGLTTDYLGTVRPKGSAPDIGAYEYDVTAPTLSAGSAIGITKDNTPDYSFTSNEAGTISYAGDCSSSDTAAIIGSKTVAFNTLADGTHSNCTVTVTDPAGNASSALAISEFTVDTTPPVTSAPTITPSTPNGSSGWYKTTAPTVTLLATDATSGVSKKHYKWNVSGSYQDYTTAFNALEGDNTLYYYSSDVAGNDETAKTVELKVDITLPTVSAFTIPTISNSLTVSINSLTASDNVAVTGYLVNESPSIPSVGDSGWVSSAPTTHTFGSVGNKTLYAWAKDAAGNISTSLSRIVAVDTTNPVTTLTPAISPDGDNGWYKTVPTLTITALDTGGTGVDHIYYNWNSASYAIYSTSLTPAEGRNTLYYYSTDKAGNTETAKSSVIKVDSSAPTISALTLPTTSTSSVVSISTFTASDDIAITGYLFKETSTTPTSSDSNWVATAPTSYTFTGSGIKILYAWTEDDAGNVSSVLSATVTIDTTSPVSSAVASIAPNGDNGWYRTPPTIVITAEDADTGVFETFYKWDDANYSSYDVPMVALEGSHILYYYSTDLAGNSETPKSLAVKVDSVAPKFVTLTPNVAFTTTSSTIRIRGTTTDDTSGVSRLDINGETIVGPAIFVKTINLNNGYNKIVMALWDTAGNAAFKMFIINKTNVATSINQAIVENPSTTNFGNTVMIEGSGNNDLYLSENGTSSTNNTQPIFKGRTFPNSIVDLEIHSNLIKTTVNSDVDGYWTYQPTTGLEAGDHSLIVSVRDSSDKLLTTSTYKFNVKIAAAVNTNMPVIAKTDGTYYWLFGGVLGIIFFILFIFKRKRQPIAY